MLKSKTYAALHRAVETELEKLLTPGGLITGEKIPPELAEQMRYAFLSGGKRLRPVMCLAACQAVSGDYRAAVPAALAIEILHTYTLVHDDLPCMDNDEYRRGKLTNHAKFGCPQAVLAGDALQALAFRLASEGDLAPSRKIKIQKTLADAASAAGVISGQWWDLFSKPPYDYDLVAKVICRKTVALFKAALEMGATAGGATKKQTGALLNFGHQFGFGFQLMDDIDDADTPGKENEMSILRVMNKKDASFTVSLARNCAFGFLDELKYACGQPAADALNLLGKLAEGLKIRE